jgi:hypothetical protein
MSADRIPCKNPDCGNTILPATAKANDGLCAPCVGRKRHAQREEFIRQNRRTVNLYEGVTDPVEVIRLMLTRRKHDPLTVYAPSPLTAEQAFAGLSPLQHRQLAGIAADALRTGDKDLAENIGKALATLTQADLDEMLHVWLDHQLLWPSVTFRNAGPVIRDRILDMIGLGTVQLNHALCALAWIGDSVVVEQFAEWDNSPPPWRTKLHVGPGIYALIGGWELTPRGRRNLFFDDCFALHIVPDDRPASGVQLLSEQNAKCPLCGDALVHLLEIPIEDAPQCCCLASVTTLAVLTCERCTCWNEFIFARIERDGQAHWHPANPDAPHKHALGIEMDRGPWHAKRVELKKRPAIQAVDWCMELPVSQIGGMPTWAQDAAYPKCPDCRRTMIFLAQLDNGAFSGHEGTYYAFLCDDCQVTATTYQQT